MSMYQEVTAEDFTQWHQMRRENLSRYMGLMSNIAQYWSAKVCRRKHSNVMYIGEHSLEVQIDIRPINKRVQVKLILE